VVGVADPVGGVLEVVAAADAAVQEPSGDEPGPGGRLAVDDCAGTGLAADVGQGVGQLGLGDADSLDIGRDRREVGADERRAQASAGRRRQPGDVGPEQVELRAGGVQPVEQDVQPVGPLVALRRVELVELVEHEEVQQREVLHLE
jgi:hypothetical protein